MATPPIEIDDVEGDFDTSSCTVVVDTHSLDLRERVARLHLKGETMRTVVETFGVEHLGLPARVHVDMTRSHPDKLPRYGNCHITVIG